VSFGLGAHNNLRASDVETLGLEGLRLSFQYGNEQVHVRLPLLGRHSVYGALAAAAVGLKLGLGWDEIVKGLRDPSSELRMAVLPGLSGSTLLDDTYNASPASTIAALNLLAEMSGRKVAVLGDMLELGSYEAEGHRLVGRRAAEVAEQVVVVGLLGRLIGEESLSAGLSASQVHFAKNNEEAVSALRELLQDGDFVLVKGSRGMAMERIVQPLVRCG
jgi:UDP-N-acetylmuramoyl-tripeptide--D-alanyl-D-alanine ligase